MVTGYTPKSKLVFTPLLDQPLAPLLVQPLSVVMIITDCIVYDLVHVMTLTQ